MRQCSMNPPEHAINGQRTCAARRNAQGLKVGEEGSQLVGRDDYTIGRKLRLNVSQGAAVTISPCGLERLQHHVWCQLKHAY
jgi:hypothetical protein